MLFIDKRNKIAPNIYIIDIGGYFKNVFEGLFSHNGPWIIICKLILTILNLYNYAKGREKNLGPVFLI